MHSCRHTVRSFLYVQEKFESFITPEHDGHGGNDLYVAGYKPLEKPSYSFRLVNCHSAVPHVPILDLTLHAGELHTPADEVSRVREGDRDGTRCATQEQVVEPCLRIFFVNFAEGGKNVEGTHFKRDIRRNTLKIKVIMSENRIHFLTKSVESNPL